MTSPRSKWSYEDWLNQLDSVSNATTQHAYQQAQRSALVAQAERAESTVGSPYSEHLFSKTGSPAFPKAGRVQAFAQAQAGLTANQAPTPHSGHWPCVAGVGE